MEEQPFDAMEMTADRPLDVTADASQEDAGHLLTLNVHGGGAHHIGGGQTHGVPMGFEGFDTHVLDALPKARLSEEEKFEREVARRRQLEAERRHRIFDAKVRTIGVDKDHLDLQVAEVVQKKKEEKELQRQEDLEYMRCNQHLASAEKNRKEAQRRAEKECKDFSLQHLHYAARKEFDLNDPKAKTKDLPMRMGDEDPRNGPASMQKFNGEDLLREERMRQQRLATADFIQQQLFEKECLKRASAGEDAYYAAQTKEIITIRNEVEEAEVALRRDFTKENQTEMLGHLAHKDALKADKAQHDAELSNKEMEHHANDSFLNEAGPRHNTNGRIIRDGYKGSTVEERVAARDHQQLQVEQKFGTKMMAGIQDYHIDKQSEVARKQLVLIEREKTRMKRMQMMENARQNQLIAEQQKVNKAAYHECLKSNIAPEFFDQFGVGTR